MDVTKVNLYLAQYAPNIPQEKTMILRGALEKASDNAENQLAGIQLTNPILILVMSIFFGGLGIDRFMVGDVGLGVCKLLFGWLTFGIWPLVDIFFCYKRAKELNLQKLLTCLSY